MNKSSPVLLAPLAALLLAGTAPAQTIASPNPLGVNGERVDLHCTSTTLTTDASAPCSDDVLKDGSGVLPGVTHPPTNRAEGIGNMGARSTGTSMGPAGLPSTGAVNSGAASVPGAMGGGAMGAATAPTRR